MARQNISGKKNGAGISAQQITLIAVSVLAIILMITTLIAFNKCSAAESDIAQHQVKLDTRFDDEISALNIMLDRQKNEAGDARISTLYEMIRHVYAADALSALKVDSYGGDELMSTDAYSELTGMLNQSISQLNAGLNPDSLLTEFGTALAALNSPDTQAG